MARGKYVVQQVDREREREKGQKWIGPFVLLSIAMPSVVRKYGRERQPIASIQPVTAVQVKCVHFISSDLFQSRQMRAVSSPSLSDNPMDPPINGKVNGEPLKIHESQPPNVSASVLQKFKKTFSQFKGGKSNGTTQSTSTQLSETATTQTATAASDTTKYRFGPLIWRSSKERRKTKHHRRDKCNSGDSGIQVELENDENIHDGLGSVETSPSFNVRVRRANSAKVTSTTSVSTVKSKAFRKNEGFEKIYSTPLPGRSLSQPYGLDQIPRGWFSMAHCDVQCEQCSNFQDINRHSCVCACVCACVFQIQTTATRTVNIYLLNKQPTKVRATLSLFT